MLKKLILCLLICMSAPMSAQAAADLNDCRNGVKANENKEYMQATLLLTKCLSLPLKTEVEAYIYRQRTQAFL